MLQLVNKVFCSLIFFLVFVSNGHAQVHGQNTPHYIYDEFRKTETFHDTTYNGVIFSFPYCDKCRHIYFQDVAFKNANTILTLTPAYNLYISDCSADTLEITGPVRTLKITNSKIKFLKITGDVFLLEINRDTIDQFILKQEDSRSRSSIRLNLDSTLFADKILIEDYNIDDFSSNGFTLPDTLTFANLAILNRMDLSKYLVSENEICYASFYNVPVENINLKFSDMRMYFPKHYNLNFEDKANLYKQLLEDFKQHEKYESYEVLDKQFSEFKYTNSGSAFGFLSNWIDKHWWDYGYNKFLVIRNAIILNLLFFGINLFFFHKLVHRGYNLERFARVDNILNAMFQNRIKRLWAKSRFIFLYTCFVFWGLKLDMDKLSIHRLGLVAYVLVQYITGIICLAYIANLIITV